MDSSEDSQNKIVYEQFQMDEVFFLGTSPQRMSVVFHGVEKATKQSKAIRYYKQKERPPYDQWLESKMLTPQREVLPYFTGNIGRFIGNSDLRPRDRLVLMFNVFKKLEKYHAEGKIHGNIHPRNILVTKTRRTVAFMDSLKGGNRNTFYSSPENELGVWHQCIDIYALGLIFIDLMNVPLYEEDLLINKLGKFRPPRDQILFPEDQDLFHMHLYGTDLLTPHPLYEKTKWLIRMMLNRNYKERIVISEVIAILRSILKEEKTFPLVNHIESYFTISLPLLPAEMVKVTVLEEWTKISEKEVNFFDFYKEKKQRQLEEFIKRHGDNQIIVDEQKEKTKIVSFRKDRDYCDYYFQYDMEQNKLSILCSHPYPEHPEDDNRINYENQFQPPLYELKINYYEKDLPANIRSRMGMRLLVTILHHTPDEMYQFCLSGKMIVRISNEYRSMLLTQQDKLQ